MKPPTTQYSKYGDKYADLWAQYKPPAQVAAELRTPSMAISDVYESYRARKAALGRAALENCALQQLDLHECYKTWSTIGGCTEPRHKLDDCFMTQQVNSSLFHILFSFFLDWTMWAVGWMEKRGGGQPK